MRPHPTLGALTVIIGFTAACGASSSASGAGGQSATPATPVGRLAAISLATRSDGEGWVAGFDDEFGALLVGPLDAQGAWRPIRVDDGDPRSRVVGLAPAVALGANGEPVVLYGAADGAVSLARRASGAWSHEEIAPANGLAFTAGALTVDAAGGVHAAWERPGGAGLVLASLAAGGCRAPDGANIRAIGADDLSAAGVTSQRFGAYVDIAISPSAAVVFAFYDAARGNLMLGSCAGTQLDLRVIDGEAKDGRNTGDVGAWASLAVDGTSGRLGMAYLDADRGVLRFATSEKGEPTTVVVDDGHTDALPYARHVGQLASLAFAQGDERSFPRIAYLDASSGELRLATMDAFGSWRLGRVAPFEPGTPGSLALAATGRDTVRVASISAAGTLQISDCEGTQCATR